MSGPEARLGFIGLGAMGAPMVRRLLAAGHAVLVHDVNPVAVAAAVSAGATARPSPAAVAAEAVTVLVSLPTPDVVRQVALGPGGLVEGAALRTYVDLSTTGAQTAVAVAAGLAPRGVVALDAPVSGGVAGAEAGTLSVMAAGDPEAFARVRPVLEVIGSNTVLVGPQVGLGQTLKLVNNLLAATTWAAACEALAMGAKAGLDPELMIGVINKSSGRSFATERFATDPVLLSADVLHLPSLQVTHPEWGFVFDADRPGATAMRQRLLAEAAGSKLRLAGAHIPFPGVIRVTQGPEGRGFETLRE